MSGYIWLNPQGNLQFEVSFSEEIATQYVLTPKASSYIYKHCQGIKEAVLASFTIGSGKWSVRVDQHKGCVRFYGQKWIDLLSELNVKPGDFISFEHKGGVSFDVRIIVVVDAIEAPRRIHETPMTVYERKLLAYHIQQGYVQVPSKFAKSCGLTMANGARLIDETGKEWDCQIQVTVVGPSELQVRLKSLKEFFCEKNLEVGSMIRLESAQLVDGIHCFNVFV